MLVMSFLLGYFLSQFNLIINLSDKKSLSLLNQELQKENRLFLKDKLKSESDLKIEKTTNLLLKKQSKKILSTITALKKELSFYRGIIYDSDKNKGIFFKNISITPYLMTTKMQDMLKIKADIKKYSSYKLNFSLIKKFKKNSYLKGSIKIALLDNLGNKLDQWKMFDNKAKPIKRFKLQFKSFVISEGFLLIKKTQPISKIVVSFINSAKGSTSASKEFDWQFDQTIAINERKDNDKGIIYVGK